jgi:hypothetical protein
MLDWIKVITKLPNSEQSYKGKVKTHNYINRQNQSTNQFKLYKKTFETAQWKSCAAFLQIFVMKSGARTIKHIYFVSLNIYLHSSILTYLLIFISSSLLKHLLDDLLWYYIIFLFLMRVYLSTNLWNVYTNNRLFIPLHLVKISQKSRDLKARIPQ